MILHHTAELRGTAIHYSFKILEYKIFGIAQIQKHMSWTNLKHQFIPPLSFHPLPSSLHHDEIHPHAKKKKK